VFDASCLLDRLLNDTLNRLLIGPASAFEKEVTVLAGIFIPQGFEAVSYLLWQATA